MILIYLLCILQLVLGQDQCCPSKGVIIGSSKDVYEFKEKRQDIADPGCKDGCVYTRDGQDYCFGSGGDFPVECKDDIEKCPTNWTKCDNPGGEPCKHSKSNHTGFCCGASSKYKGCCAPNKEACKPVTPKCPDKWTICDNDKTEHSPCKSSNSTHTGYCCGTSSPYKGCCAPYKSACKPGSPKFVEGRCWNDANKPPLLKGPIVLKLNDHEKCYTACDSKWPNSIFYGLENGTDCYCGDQEAPTGSVTQVPANNCSTSCPGNPAFTCGGSKFINVFLMSSPPDGLCWIDAHLPKLLEYGPIPLPLNDVTNCKAACKHRYPGTKYLGLENGNDCYCGSTKPPTLTVKLVPASHCNIPCPGNAGQFCGSLNYINVYNI